MSGARAELLDEFGNVVGGAFPGGETTVPRHPQPDGRARGAHDPAAAYFAMDVVAFNGSEWRAVRDGPGPLPGDGWRPRQAR